MIVFHTQDEEHDTVYLLLRRAGEARRCSIESTQSFVIPAQHEEPL